MTYLNDLLKTWGYLALFIGTFLEGETILIVAGILASRGRLNLHYAILAAFAGSMFGDQCVFLLARYKSSWVLKKFSKFDNKISKALRLLEKNSIWLLLSFRFFYGLRNVISIAAGLSQVPKKKFALLNGIGAMTWALSFGYGGYYVGRKFEKYLESAKEYEIKALIAIGVVVVIYWVYKKFRKKPTDNPS
ncbi:MAG: hypothetical protein A2X86_01485 [Bdellovibrionales bacterium GWA2_49_15]|nr:MAG: hypothetical protein A2X86_01485 [Bdellovibrionales bacterium GWA2_49_15]